MRWSMSASLRSSAARSCGAEASGAPLIWLFIVPEAAFCVAQWLPVSRENSA